MAFDVDDKKVKTVEYGYKENGRTVVTKGPLVKLQDHIISVDKRDHLAILNIEFLDREIKAGIEMQNKEI